MDWFLSRVAMMMNWKSRTTAAAVHLGLSGLVAAMAAWLVFRIWYPHPYNQISGGRDLFTLIVAVDLVLGPLLTFAVYNVAKRRRELLFDILVIATLQAGALGYGLWTVFQARPVYLVHEVDRFQVVTAADIDATELKDALPELQALPKWRVRTIGVRKAKDSQEMMASIEQAMAGRDVSLRPDWWVPMGPAQFEILAQRGKNLDWLRNKGPEAVSLVDQALRRSGAAEDDLWAFPVMARTTGWSVLVHRQTHKVVGFVHVDGF